MNNETLTKIDGIEIAIKTFELTSRNHSTATVTTIQATTEWTCCDTQRGGWETDRRLFLDDVTQCGDWELNSGLLQCEGCGKHCGPIASSRIYSDDPEQIAVKAQEIADEVNAHFADQKDRIMAALTETANEAAEALKGVDLDDHDEVREALRYFTCDWAGTSPGITDCNGDLEVWDFDPTDPTSTIAVTIEVAA